MSIALSQRYLPAPAARPKAAPLPATVFSLEGATKATALGTAG